MRGPLSRRILTTIKGNSFWAFGYIAALPLVAAGLLDPLIAAASMALSSVFDVSNGFGCAGSVQRVGSRHG
jgi:Cu+-exporting ATPase